MPIEKNSMPSPIWRPALGFVAAATDLYRQGDICSTYFVVLSCWIALSVLLDDGSCQILDFALPGAVLGLQSTQNTPMYHSARCLSITRSLLSPITSSTRLSRITRVSPSCSAGKSHRTGACTIIWLT